MTQSFKLLPSRKVQRRIRQRLSLDWREPVTLIGTRLDESAERARSMRSRGDDGDEPRRDSEGMLVFAPISHLTTDEIWELIGLAASGIFKTYSTFDELKEVYAAAGASECAVIGAEATEVLRSRRPCGSRTGCSLCVCIGEEDRSLNAMIATNDRYAFMKPLQWLREFIYRTRYDLDRRAWLGRTIDAGGHIYIGPDTYSNGMVEELLRYCLTIDMQERERAARDNQRARFELISLQQLVLIDFHWSVQGLHKPFHALAILKEIEEGARYPVPAVPRLPAAPLPPRRRMHVGDAWLDANGPYGGLRDALLEHFSECGRGARVLPNGATVTAYDVDQALAVDEEGADLFLQFERDRMLMEHHEMPGALPTVAAMTYLQFGVVQLAANAQGKVNEMLRRTRWRHEHGLTALQWGNGRELWERAAPTPIDTPQLDLFGAT